MAVLKNLIGVLLVAAIVFHSGCSCRQTPANQNAKKEEKPEQNKPKPDFESKRILVSPSHADSADGTGRQGMKPGHWYSATQDIKANNFDFLQGQLTSYTQRQGGRKIPIENTNFNLRVIRPAALPKGQGKNFEVTFFTPTARGPIGLFSINSDLGYRSGSRVMPLSDATMRLDPHQYYFVILAANPDDYKFLKYLDTITPPVGQFVIDASKAQTDYLLTVPDTKDRVDLPSSPLAWTSIGYLLWDNFEGAKLTRDQQRAMIDWIHWGGQLIVSGPDSLNTLPASFLGKLLPATAEKTRPIPAESFDEINAYWSFQHDANLQNQSNMKLTNDPEAPLEMVGLKLHDDATYIPETGQLIVERRLGRGRIVMTAFRMSARQFTNWTPYDNLFNNAILRRAPRRFEKLNESVDWVDAGPQFPVGARLAHETPLVAQQLSRVPAEALLTTKLRYFSRDASAATTNDGDREPRALQLDVDGYAAHEQGGLAAWNDFSACGSEVNSALTRSGGIEVPDASFILKALGAYLLVLVPANWIVFRAINRVEWAWFAIPVIAIIGTFFVVRMAQLDIGFARSRTELNIVETQPGHQRGHLSRYTGLYTSLSTSYELGFSDSSALALPFGSRDFADKTDQTVTLRMGGGKTGEGDDAKRTKVRLQGFSVDSNNSGMVHSEQMFDLGGKMSIQETNAGLEVLNNTDYSLNDAAVATRIDGAIHVAWIGTLEAQQKKTVHLQAFGGDRVDFSEWDQNDLTMRDPPEGELRLRNLLEMALSRARLNDGDVRMTGWTDEELPGLVISPRASQTTSRTVFVANLRYGVFPAPRSDANLLTRVRTADDDEIDAEFDGTGQTP
ncbi:MAG: hypothetical protein KDB27_13355 [Planctomycetales bacterium]|nr:hypothetical protein [Planctomycetales bacterium]